MEIAEAFNFLRILFESIKLLSRNGNYMLPITILSLLLPSILILIYSFSFQLLMRNFQALGFWVLLVIEIILLITYVGISLSSRIATISVLSMSYTGKTPSIQDLFSRIKRTMKSQLCTNFKVSRGQMPIIFLVGVFFAFVVIYPSTIKIIIAVLLGILVFTYSLYIAVVSVTAIVVSVVEEICDGNKAVERATELVEGQRIHGFLMNLSLNLPVLIGLLGYWMMIGFENLTVVALVFVNMLSLLQIFSLGAYTVFYFQCKKHRGEEIESVGDVKYTKFPTDQLAYDVV